MVAVNLGSTLAPSSLGGIASAANALAATPQTALNALDKDENAAKDKWDKQQAMLDARDDQIVLDAKNMRMANPPPPQKPPVTQPTSPQQAWGSSAMLMALLASAFTRNHATTALNAAAAVLNAYKKGDQDAANTAFQTWKVQNDNWMKAEEFQNKAYEQAEGVSLRARAASDRELDSSDRHAEARYRAVASAMNDEKMLLALNEHGFIAGQQLNDERERLRQAAEKAAAANEVQHAEQVAMRAAIDQVHASPEYKAISANTPAGAAARAEMDLEAISHVKGVATALTEYQQDQLADHIHDQIAKGGQTSKALQVLKNAEPVIALVEDALKTGKPIDGNLSSAFMELNSQALTGGVARRGMIQLQIAGANVMDQFSTLAARFEPGGGGGHVSREMLATGVKIDRALRANADKIYDYEKNEAIARLKRFGIDPAKSFGNDLPTGADVHAPTYAPPPEIQKDPKHTLGQILGVPVKISSEYRPPAVNAALPNASKTSEHMQLRPGDYAVDFVPQGASIPTGAYKLANFMKDNHRPFDQIEITPTHVHIGFGAKNRGEIIYRDGAKPLQFADAEQVKAAVQQGQIGVDEGVWVLQNKFSGQY